MENSVTMGGLKGLNSVKISCSTLSLYQVSYLPARGPTLVQVSYLSAYICPPSL